MSRDLLEKYDIDLPFLPLTTVGSFPKPEELKEARRKQREGEISREELDAQAREATKFWLNQQEMLGYDVLVDGEQYRGDMATYFAENLDGFEIGGLVRSYGNRYYRKPIVVDEIVWNDPITVDWWKFTQELTDKPVKGMLTGPYTMMDWTFNEHYPSRADAARAFAAAIRKEVQALIDAGCKIIQIDEPACSVRTDEMDLVVEVVNQVVEDLDAYFLTHICYGKFDEIYPKMLDIPVHNFDLEFSNSDLYLLDLFEDIPFTSDLSFGAVDVHDHRIEKPGVVRERIEKALEVIPEERLWVSPDCGLKTRTIEESVGKMEVITTAVQEIRSARS